MLSKVFVDKSFNLNDTSADVNADGCKGVQSPLRIFLFRKVIFQKLLDELRESEIVNDCNETF